MAGQGQSTASKTDRGQFDNKEYITEVIYSGSDQDSDSGYGKDTADSREDRRRVKWKRSKREDSHQ